ncbi:MAG: Lrp/AsnC family transcriptional regulator [Gammaproteobacteria bacterium]
MSLDRFTFHEQHHLTIETIQQMLNEFQHDFPLSATPYADMAEKLGIQEQALLDLLADLKAQGILSRVGAVFTPNRIGASTLAAMAVPEHKLLTIADIISSYSAVNHNYEREHHFNLWFVATAESSILLNDILADMEQKTGYRILSLPMEQDYHIDLAFPLQLIHAGQHA